MPCLYLPLKVITNCIFLVILCSLKKLTKNDNGKMLRTLPIRQKTWKKNKIISLMILSHRDINRTRF